MVPSTRRTGHPTGRGGVRTSPSSPWPQKGGRTSSPCRRRIGLQDPQIWRVLPKGRSDILFLLACDVQMRQAEAVAKHDGPRRHTARGRVEAHLARMLAFDFEPCRACTAQGWYWMRGQFGALGDLESPLSPIERDLGPAIATVRALHESTVRDAA
jgi:hypothetical protein